MNRTNQTKPVLTKICVRCGKEYTALNWWSRFCSNACKQADAKARKKQQPAASKITPSST